MGISKKDISAFIVFAIIILISGYAIYSDKVIKYEKELKLEYQHQISKKVESQFHIISTHVDSISSKINYTDSILKDTIPSKEDDSIAKIFVDSIKKASGKELMKLNKLTTKSKQSKIPAMLILKTGI